MDNTKIIDDGKIFLGIELGSTRIKAVLTDENYNVLASGNHAWENRFENGVWTYHLDDVWDGVQDAYKILLTEVEKNYNTVIKSISAIGFSAMMHGYLAFDKNDNLLVPFRTWRNTTTQESSTELTKIFNFNIPQRWSIAHLYQAMLNNEPHVKDIDYITTLAGYIHYKLTGQKVLGVGEASGMFPINSNKNDYDETMINQFNELSKSKNYSINLIDILPKVLVAGENAGILTETGAKLIDISANLSSGSILCPPEGDAGTGMTATNSVKKRTGNVSAGTSIFAMAVLEEKLKGTYPEIDVVTTPSGKPVAMVHCNNCTSDLDAWVNLFKDYNKLIGANISTPELYDKLYETALNGDKDCSNILSYNYISGEPVTDLVDGKPLIVRSASSSFNISNFMRAQLFATMATLKIGMDILFEKENVKLDCLLGHGGLFKTKLVGQKLMAAAMNTPVSVMETAGEGGAWGIAILAGYAKDNSNMTFEDYLDNKVFNKMKSLTIEPDREDVDGFKRYIENYKKGLNVEKSAVENIKG